MTRSLAAAITFVLLVAAMTHAVTTAASAQCRPGWVGPLQDTMTVSMLCAGQYVQRSVVVTFCIPNDDTIIPPQQYHIIAIAQLPPTRSECDIDSMAFLDAGKQLIEDNAGDFNCEPGCPEVIPQFRISKAGCWKKVIDSTGVRYEPCTTGEPHDCYDLYEVCCEEDENEFCDKMTAYYQGSTTPEGSCSDPCYPVCSVGHSPESYDCPARSPSISSAAP